jgi:PAS domain S-box-containing protein
MRPGQVVSNALQIDQQISLDQARLHPIYSLLETVPFAVAALKGPDLIIEFINQHNLDIWQRKKEDVIGKPLFVARPDIQASAQPIHEEIYRTGKRFESTEIPIEIQENGQATTRHFDVVIDLLKDDSGAIVGQLATSIDVTEKVLSRKKVEESATAAIIAKNEAEKMKRLYETITGNTPDLIYVFDLNYRFTYANKALLEMWGKTWDAAIGRGLRENGYEEWHAQMHEREIDQVNFTKKSIRGEVSFPHATLGKRVYDYILVPVLNEKGEVEAVAGTTRDITDQKKFEQTILESNERFRNLADESPMFVFLIDADLQAPVSYWNKTWLQYTGQSNEEALGRAWDGILHSDDVPTVMEHYTPAFKSRQAYFIPAVRVRRHDGEYRWHTFKGNPRFSESGAFDGYVGVGFDVHEQKLAEDALKESEACTRLAIEAANLGTFEIDVDAKTMVYSPRAAEIFGLDQSVQWSYESFIEKIHPDDLAIRNKAHEHALMTGELTYEARMVRADNSIRWIGLSARYFQKGNNQKTLIGIIMDITEQKKAAELLEQKVRERTKELAAANEMLHNINKELKRSNQNLEEFAHAASHDLKEPVRKIHFYTNQLKEQLNNQLKEDQIRAFSRIENATERMGNLIDDLLLYSHVSQRPIDMESVDLNQKVANVLEDLELDIKEKGAKIKVERLPVVKGYRRQLQQLLQNLISNAIKYSKKDQPPQIKIMATVVKEKERDYHQISITDNGIGFDPEYSDRIFQMFSRLHGKAEYSGTGVGLSIVKKVVENHDGLIMVESQPGVGSTFQVYLPI